MDINEIFRILEIEETRDENAIKSAYRDKLISVNPEEDAEGFKRLRTAYEEACRYAKSTDSPADIGIEQDNTPSGQWVKKAVDIYKNIISRCDTEKWKELFDDDTFVSLEEEENCRVKFIVFLMSNYRLPTAVWRLIDSKLKITSNQAQLREKFSPDFVRYIVTKCMRGEDVEFEKFEGAPDADYDRYFQYYDMCWNAIQSKNYTQAKEFVDNAEALNIFHPVMGICRAHILAAENKTDEAVRYINSLLEKSPEDIMVAYNAAEIMWNNGRKADAAKIYENLKSSNDRHYMANYRLSEWYYGQREYREAKKCAEKVLVSGADDSFIELLKKINGELEPELLRRYEQDNDILSGLELGWCYLQDGSTTKGIRIAEEVFDRVPQDRTSEIRGLLTKLYMESYEPDRAFDMAEKWADALNKRISSDESGEEKLKDRERLRQCHVIRMHCFKAFGDANMNMEKCGGEEAGVYHKRSVENYHKAIEEAEGLTDGGVNDVVVLMELSHIYRNLKEYDKSFDISKKLIVEFQAYAAYANILEVCKEQWDARGVVQYAGLCIKHFPDYARAYEHAAKVYIDLKKNDELTALLDEAQKKDIKSVILDAYRYQMKHDIPDSKKFDELLIHYRQTLLSEISGGNTEVFESAERTITEYLYYSPGVYMLNERGFFYKEAHCYEKAIKDFEKSLEENPFYPYSYHNMALCYKYLGNYDKAISCFNRAVMVIFKEPEASGQIYFDIANTYSVMGEHRRALKYYKEYIYGDNKNKSFFNFKAYAECLARNGETENAVQLIFAREEVPSSDRYSFMCYLYNISGMEKEARELLKKWAAFSAAENPLWKSLVNKNKYINKYADRTKYYYEKAWVELLYGIGRYALRYFGRLISYDCLKEDYQCDAVFASILYGDVRRGRRYAQMLKEFLKREKLKRGNIYYNYCRKHVRIEILSIWYDDNDGEIERLLRESHSMEICHDCTSCLCKGLECLEVLFLLKKGKTDEAAEKLERSLRLFPFDEYMNALKHSGAVYLK